MRGDFSRWDAILKQNINGVLHQQGRVLLDRDWNDQRRLTGDWQDRAGRDVLGRGVMAVPADAPSAFKISEATAEDGRARLTVQPGTGWADGLVVSIRGVTEDTGATEDTGDTEVTEAPATRQAAYLEPPVQVAAEVDGMSAGDRDAVILEVWREELHGFQRPDLLIEPALGGPDTTERIHTAMRFRLFRMQPEETCQSIANQLRDDPALKGRLTASLDPTTTTDGDCPTVESGGYVGFEHALYRIEIARVNATDPMFKWSRFNGGLVGRGRCDLGGADPRVVITANDQAIKTAGNDNFYLEVVALDTEQGYWRVTYGAKVTLNGDDLEIGTVRYQEPVLPTGRVFFRLWDGIAPIGDHLDTDATPSSLLDGICLAFEAPDATAIYRPGDYWTFHVRAGGIANDQVLIDHEPPEGITYHRVPLAEITWNAELSASFESGEIADCRKRFRPMTDRNGCCTFSVGDGRHSRGDFNSIEEALRHLPPQGGQLCVLPGTHRTNVVLLDRTNVRIHGCGRRTRILPREEALSDPVFRIQDSRGIVLEALDIVAAAGTGIFVQESERGAVQAVKITDNRILAADRGIDVIGGQNVTISGNTIRILDREEGDVGISIKIEDGIVERNDVRIIPFEEPQNDGEEPERQPPPVLDPCAKPDEVFRGTRPLIAYAVHVWAIFIFETAEVQYRARGGIQVHAGSEQVILRSNRIVGGAGNGITLGSAVDLAALISDEEPQGATFSNGSEDIEAQLVDVESGEPVEDVGMTFTGPDGVRQTATAPEGSGGWLVVQAKPGEYRITSADPGYEVRRVKSARTRSEEVVWYIEVAETEAGAASDFAESLAFVYDVTIEDNDISGMGRSGIGLPDLDLSFLDDGANSVGGDRLEQVEGILPWLILAISFGVLSAPVSGLVIVNNRIRRCLLSSPVRERGTFPLLPRGEGGISLGVTEGLRIEANVIERNGPDHSTPVCGIYVLTAVGAEISRNQIEANGPISSSSPSPARPGMRGGIVVLLASTSSLLEGIEQGQEAGPAGSGLAFRSHENIVEQPFGRALTVGAWGSVSVQENRLHTVVADEEFLGTYSGAVLIVNIGGMDRMAQTTAALSNEALAARSVVDMAASTEARHPDGNTLFMDNQVRLDQRRSSRVAQLIISLDDLCYTGNQAEVGNEGDKDGSPWMNALLCGASLRVLVNRFKEPPLHGRKLRSLQTDVISALTISAFLNNTSKNQGDHCILGATLFAAGMSHTEPRVLSGNQTLFTPAASCAQSNEYLASDESATIPFLLSFFRTD